MDDAIDELMNAFGGAADAPPAPPGAEERSLLDDLLDYAAQGAAAPAAPGDASFAPPVPAPPARAPQGALPPAAPAGAAEPGEPFKISDMKEHARKKGMWAGALKPIAMKDLLGAAPPERAAEGPEAGLVVFEIARPHTPALLKIMDEILVNAVDHAMTCGPRQKVTRIEVRFDRASGEVAVRNDGPGIPVRLHAEASAMAKRDVYVPEVAFAWFLSGTNVDKPKDCIRGGINGLGAKLANVHSAALAVETTDAAARRHYSQRFRDRLAVTEPPRITDLRGAHGLGPGAAQPHTRVVFTPAYAELGYAPGPGGPLAPADAADLDAWLRLRAHQAAAYVGPAVAVTYNGAPCRTTGAAALGQLLLTALGPEAEGALVLSGQARAAAEPYSRHPWQLAVVVLPPGRKAGRRAAAQNMTLVNGVLCNKGGHVQHLKRLLSGAVEERLRRATKRRGPKAGAAVAKVLAQRGEKAPLPRSGRAEKAPKAAGRMSPAETLAGVRLVMCGALPGADWGGQRKDELQVPREAVEGYALPAAFLKRVGEAVAERILQAQDGRAKKVAHEKYRRARHAGRPQRRHTLLLAAEGDSAITLLRAGLTQRADVAPGGPSFDWCGVISLQGVVLNAAREVTEVGTAGGETLHVRSAKLQENKRLLALADAFGLRYGCRYETAEELATLRYGRLVLCVDQDLDGAGKIAPLVLVWLHLFWPALFRAGRVGRLMTPLVRVYPRGAGAPLEFHYEEELAGWLAAHPDWRRTHRDPEYYKGLASHSDAQVRAMFTPAAFAAALYTYTLDDAARALFDVYFGPRPGPRKAALATPVVHLPPAEAAALRARREIPLGRVQLDIDAKAFKHGAIARQLPGGADGLNPARRKILHGAALRLGKTPAKALKIFQLGGAVADKAFYHHGDASLNATITYMAQAFPGARRYPYLEGVGQLGSRHGEKAGSPRYVSVRLAALTRVAFPAADRWHLPHVFEDGHRAEPAYYVPVLPMGVLESYRIVTEGWKHTGYGRDLEATLAVVRAYIGGEPALAEAAERLRAQGAAALPAIEELGRRWPLPVSTRGFGGEVRAYRGEDYSFGSYAWDASCGTVRITELPIGVSTAAYLEALLKPGSGGEEGARARFIEDVEDNSTVDRVDLLVRLKAGAFEALSEAYGGPEIDAVEDALMLRGPLRAHLNYYGARGEVLEFGQCYLAAVLYWAPLRRAMYVERLTRERLVAELRILEETQVLRYTELAAELALARAESDEAAEALLAGRGFPRLCRRLVHQPEYTPNADLKALATGGAGANYDYILDLRERDLVQSAVARRRETLGQLRETLARAEARLAETPVAGASVWLAEIEAFLAAAQ